MQNYIDNEEEETLSLCDLSISNDEPISLENQSLSSSSSSSSTSIDQDLFEFFSGGWSSTSATTTTISPDHIIFCGKTIPSKQSIRSNDQIFRRNSDSLFYKRSKYPSSSCVTTTPRSNSLPSPTHINSPAGKLGGKNDISIKREASLSSVTKSRWFLFMFGNMTSVPKKMKLNDLRSRQSWGGRPAATTFRSDGGGEEVVGGGGHHATTVWKSTFSCFGGL